MKKRIIKYAGSLIAVLSVVYVFRALNKVDWNTVSASFNLLWIPQFLLLVAVYILVNYIRAVNWTRIIDYFGNSGKHNRELILLYLKTEVAKYIPSNMVHLAGRHILARELGYKDTVLMMANIFDMLLLLFTAMFIVIAGMLSGLIELPFFVESALSRGVYKAVALIIVFSGLAVLLWLIKFRRNKIMEYIRLNKISDLVRIVLLFLPGFILSTFILLIIFKFMLGAAVGFADAVYFFTAFTMAWTAGFVIPGAPGGIGIRETVILILFGGLYGENNTVIAALLMRLISIAGDVAVWIIATLSEKTEKKEKK